MAFRALIFAGVAGALAAAKPAPPPDPAPVLAADRAFAELARVKGPRVAFARTLAEETVFVNEGEVVAGRRRRFVAMFPRDPAALRLRWKPVGGAIAADGTLGVTWGTWERRTAGAAVSRGAYTTVWRKAADGRWRIILDGGSAKPARP